METATTDRPTILVFSQNGIDGGLKKMKEKANVLQAYYSKPGEPAALLEAHPSARAIWIVDPQITTSKYAALSRQVVDYVRNGGTAILGGFFTSFVRPNDFDKWIRTAWGLPWMSGQYERTTVVFQNSATGRRDAGQRWRDDLVAAYSSKAVFLKGVAAEDSWYSSPQDARSESFVFGPVPVEAQTAVAFAKVGSGHLGYTGDVNNEEGTTLAVLAMMGLNVDVDEM